MSRHEHQKFERQAFDALVEAHTQIRDFPEWLTCLVAGVTAHVGGIDQLTAGRPGSWEAGHLATWMESAGCELPELLDAYRRAWHDNTAPNEPDHPH